jgi:hypothetical protein
MVVLSLLTLPVLLMISVSLPWQITALLVMCIVVAICGPSSLYMTSQIVTQNGLKKLFYLPVLMCIGVGIALSNTRAVIEAMLNIKSGFVRTPKQGDAKTSRYSVYQIEASVLPIFEILLGFYCMVSLLYYLEAEHYMIGPFLLIYACGFLLVGIRSFIEGLTQG